MKNERKETTQDASRTIQKGDSRLDQDDKTRYFERKSEKIYKWNLTVIYEKEK